MTIKTLEYIHALLIEDERKRKEVYENPRRLQREYEENGADEELINRQDEDAGKFRESRITQIKHEPEAEICFWLFLYLDELLESWGSLSFNLFLLPYRP